MLGFNRSYTPTSYSVVLQNSHSPDTGHNNLSLAMMISLTHCKCTACCQELKLITEQISKLNQTFQEFYRFFWCFLQPAGNLQNGKSNIDSILKMYNSSQ